VRRIALAFAAALLAVAGDAHEGASRSGGVPLPATEDMRRNHMKYLFQQRDRTMHEGIRTPRFSLKNCVDCHASAKTGSVLGPKGFCADCHAYASVKLDCFECHSPVRQTKAATR